MQSKPTFKEVYDSYGLNMEDLTGPNQRHLETSMFCLQRSNHEK